MRLDSVTYAAVFKDGSFFERDTFEEVMFHPSAFLFLKIEPYKRFTSNSGNSYHSFNFMPINKDGNQTTFQVGDLEVVEIVREQGAWEKRGIIFKILDLRENVIQNFSSERIGLEVFKDELFPFLNKLNEAGTWENYQKIVDLETSNNKLNNTIKELENKLIALEAEIERLKASTKVE
jgi:hypothetical protein